MKFNHLGRAPEPVRLAIMVGHAKGISKSVRASTGRKKVEATAAVDQKKSAGHIPTISELVILTGGEPHALSRFEDGRLTCDFTYQFAEQAVADFFGLRVLVNGRVRAW